MLWVGLTGCMGCGKSTVGDYYKSLGYPVISADEVVKNLYKEKEILLEIIKAFDLDPGLKSKDLINLLSKTVFKDKEKLSILESILHPKVKERVIELRKNLKTKVAFYDVPLLFEKNMERSFDYIITVGSSKEIQKERIKKRNKKWSEAEIDDRIKNQLSIEYKRVNSDFYISNDSSLDDLKIKSKKVLDRLLGI